MNDKRFQLLGIPVDNLSMDETVTLIDESVARREKIHHVVINAAKVVNALKDEELKKSIVDCDIINADGQSIVWASRILRKPLLERVAGIDLMQNLVARAAKKKYKIYLLGASEEVVQKVVQKYKEQYGESVVAGYKNGFFSADKEEIVAMEIAASGADMLFVAMTSPKKEIFLSKYKDVINIPFIMGVGGSFDVVSGKTKRAPLWMQRNGLEWLYRVMQEPRRLWRRYLTTNCIFIYLLLKEKLSTK
jgi:N-acetylglucosaminyldiphosphoundecaprenol N-acetyl-beta-D-mannosaminyltransferase